MADTASGCTQCTDSYDVIIIGGGVAWLSAARELLKNNCNSFCVVEAKNRLGGRLKQVHGITPWPLDAGAEIIHGEESELAMLLKKSLGMTLVEREFPNYVYWPDTDCIEYVGQKSQESHAVVKRMYNILDEVWTSHMSGCGIQYHCLAQTGTVEASLAIVAVFIVQLSEIQSEKAPSNESMAEWMHKQCNGDSRTISFADAYYANDIGTELLSMGVAESSWEAKHWCDGDSTVVKGVTFSSLVTHLSRCVPVRLSWPVQRISICSSAQQKSSSYRVAITGPEGQVMHAKAVVCAVPLTQLQKNVIEFQPNLPGALVKTLNAITVQNAVKVWAVFREPFWVSSEKLSCARRGAGGAPNGEFWDMLCPGSEFPEFWAPKFDCEAENGPAVGSVTRDGVDSHLLTAFVCGSKADDLSRLGPDKSVRKFLEALDKIFGNLGHLSSTSGLCPSGEGPASSCFERGGWLIGPKRSL